MNDNLNYSPHRMKTLLLSLALAAPLLAQTALTTCPLGQQKRGDCPVLAVPHAGSLICFDAEDCPGPSAEELKTLQKIWLPSGFMMLEDHSGNFQVIHKDRCARRLSLKRKRGWPRPPLNVQTCHREKFGVLHPYRHNKKEKF